MTEIISPIFVQVYVVHETNYHPQILALTVHRRLFSPIFVPRKFYQNFL